ncbi:MAG: MAPEG family protein [Parvularculaceae bacterium]
MLNATPEITWLTYTILMTALFWVPYIINRILEDGLWTALKNPNPDDQPKAGWAVRMMAAHENAVENLVIFAPLAVIVSTFGFSSNLTIMATKLYFFARLAHYIIYSAGIPGLRTLTFAAGFAAQLILALTILGVI